MKPRIRPGIGTRVDRAFSMLELVVVLSLLILLAGVLTPIVLQSKKDAQAAKILAIADALQKACERFYLDNGSFPKDTTEQGATATHDLTVADPKFLNWKGPYLQSPLQVSDNPEGKKIVVKKSLSGVSPPFSSGTGEGAAAVFYGIPEDVALIVNNLIDGEEPTDWEKSGSVTYTPASSGMQSYGTIVPVGDGSTILSNGGDSGTGGHSGTGLTSGTGSGSGSESGSESGSGSGSSEEGATGVTASKSMTTASKLGTKTPAFLNIWLHGKSSGN